MRTSPAGRATDRPGFTLIELLVVITVLAILSLGVGLSAGGAFGGRDGGSAGERLAASVAQARDGAILGRVTLGLQPAAQGWTVMRRDAAGGWQPLGGLVRTGGLVWRIGGEVFQPLPTRAVPPILFHPDGTATAFSLLIQQGAQPQTCTVNRGGVLECDNG